MKGSVERSIFRCSSSWQNTKSGLMTLKLRKLRARDAVGFSEPSNEMRCHTSDVRTSQELKECLSG